MSFLKVKCQNTKYSVDLGIDGGFSIIYADVWPLDSWSSISQPESVDLGSFYILLHLVLNGFVKIDTWTCQNWYRDFSKLLHGFADIWTLDSWRSISQPESADLGSFHILLQSIADKKILPLRSRSDDPPYSATYVSHGKWKASNNLIFPPLSTLQFPFCPF